MNKGSLTEKKNKLKHSSFLVSEYIQKVIKFEKDKLVFFSSPTRVALIHFCDEESRSREREAFINNRDSK